MLIHEVEVVKPLRKQQVGRSCPPGGDVDLVRINTVVALSLHAAGSAAGIDSGSRALPGVWTDAYGITPGTS